MSSQDLREKLQKSAVALNRALAEIKALKQARGEAVAVVGMGCRFPGGVRDRHSFWQLLEDGVDAVTEVPAERWDVDAWYDPDPEAPGKTASRWGGFIDGVELFDAAFFGISPNEARAMDPQQRLLLEVAWEAFEDAGVAAEALEGSETGVFVGGTSSEYGTALLDAGAAADAYAATGNTPSVLAGRLSYVLGLRGPAMSVDTACSSSLVAVHLACQSLRQGECDLALAGGVHLILNPAVMAALSRLQALSPTGRCRTFSADADGFVTSDGCGLVVLKRLSRALEDGDRVLAVIRGSGVNQDGRSSALTAPNGPAQQKVIRRALKQAGVAPADVGYVECHGTGTTLGDPIEIQALADVLGEGRSAERPVSVGSVKSNFGHAEGAAGVAGLMKAVLALRHKSLPASLHFAAPNPLVPWEELPVRVVGETRLWKNGGSPRIAGVSAFGISGTNAHVILEEAPGGDPAAVEPGSEACVLPLSAKTPGGLLALAERFADHLEGRPEQRLRDVCHTAALGRGHFAHRLAVVGADRAELRVALAEAVAVPEALAARPRLEGGSKVVFVFPGQGSQWPGMGRELLAREPAFCAAAEACDEAIRRHTGWSALERLTEPDDEAWSRDDVVQPLLFTMAVSLSALWRSWGVEPRAVLGYSQGEIAAAHVAGALALDDAARVVCERSRLIREQAPPGGMALVRLPHSEVAERLAPLEGRVSVAVVNSASSTVVAGNPEDVEALSAEWEAAGIFCRRIDVAYASHCAHMEELAAPIEQSLAGISPRRVSIPMVSTLTGELVEGPELTPEYWSANLCSTVRFGPAMERLLESGHAVFVEQSAHPIQVQAMLENAGERPVAILGSLQRDSGGRAEMLRPLAGLYAFGLTPDWRAVLGDGGRPVTLPSYPFERRRFWIDGTPAGPSAGAPVLEAEATVDDAAGAETRSRLDVALAGSTSGGRQAAVVLDLVRTAVARVLGFESGAEVAPDTPLRDLGLDSLTAVRLRDAVSALAGRQLSATLAFDHPTAEAIVRHLLEDVLALEEKAAPAPAALAAWDEPIAILGMGCRFPGGVRDPEGFWRLLADGVDAVGEVPAQRWDVDEWYDPDPDAAGTMTARWGGFLSDVDLFDADFFGVAPREAEAMDPQQRLLLEVTWEALENAGIAPDALAGSATGVFVGLSGSDYGAALYNGSPADIDVYSMTGSGLNVAAGRLSYVLGLRGPAVAMDTACSSSLVSVHMACQSLRSGETDLALAGGVNLILSPRTSIAVSRIRALSPTGRCRAFSADADGFVRGEGAGVVALKRLSDARRDGDRVLAVIRGSAVNQDGRSSGLTVPHGPSQEAVIRRALEQSGLGPADVDFVECHGTGTNLGDPIEILAVGEVLGPGRPAERPIYLGAVKSNIGHIEAAAGIASLMKSVLCLRHGALPANLHFAEPNPYVPWDELPVRVLSEEVPWPAGEAPRYAGVSSFGISGTNAHVVLGEAPAPESVAEARRELHLLPLSAKSPEALRELADLHGVHLAASPELALADVCRTASVGRNHFEHRLVALGADREELGQALEAAAAGTTGVLSGRAAPTPPRVAFLFTGQGSQYAGMGRGLYDSEPVFRETLERCAALFDAELERPLLEVMYPPEGEDSPIGQTLYTQPALFALEYALAALWRSWGVEPDALLGHSIGEVVAAAVAGVLSLEDAVRLSAARGRLMQSLPEGGAMVSVRTSQERASAAITAYEDRLAIAAINAPDRVTLSGDAEALELVVAELEVEGVETKPLKVSHAFHSPLMEPIAEELSELLSDLEYRAPRIPLVSNLTGELVEEVDGSYWRDHALRPVRFHDGLLTLSREGIGVGVELGPHPVLSGLGASAVEEIGWLTSLRRGRDDGRTALTGLAQAYVRGVAIDWRALTGDGPKVELPTYPFQRRSFWRMGAVAGPAAEPSRGETGRDWLYEVRWPEAEPLAAEGSAAAGAWLLLADQGGFGARLASEVEARGADCVLLERPADAARTSAEIEETLAQRDDWRGVAYLWALDVAPARDEAAGEIRAAVESACLPVIDIVRGLTALAGEPRLWLVTRAAQAVEERPVSVGQTPLWGLGRVTALEHPEVWGGLVDLDPAVGDEAPLLADELMGGGDEDQLAYRGGRRLAARLVRAAAPAPAAPPPVSAQGTYLVTGGLGALGLHLARWLVAHGARHLVLTGRTGLPERASWDDDGHPESVRSRIATVRELEAAGARVTVESVDVADAAAMAALVSDLDPGLRGVMHVAGVLDLRPLLEADGETLRSVLASKVTGGWILHRLTEGLELDFFVLFSSAAAVSGGAGQAEYAAANIFLDALAHHRRSLGLPALSLDWGLWKEGGMGSAQGHTQLEAVGVLGMKTEQALDALVVLLSTEVAQRMVTRTDWDRFLPIYSARRPRRFFDEVKSRSEESDAVLSVAERWRDLAPDQARAALAETVRSAVSTVLGFASDEVIEADRGFADLGMDSLMSVELRDRLRAELGLSLPLTVTFDHPSVERLTEYLAGEVLGREPADVSTARERRFTHEPIAIVGAACRFPGGDGLEEFWQLLDGDGDAISEVTKERWDKERWYDPDPEAEHRTYVAEAGFLADVAGFDAPFFQISPREAVSMDPQQRLTLETAWAALEDAALVPAELRDSRGGVYVGVGANEYAERVWADPAIDETYAGTGSAISFPAGRLAYVLGLRGPAVAMDTACSSSLVAVHMACRGLQQGDCDMALAGGVNVLLSPRVFVNLARMKALSPSGRCKTFDASADGYARGEGCGMVVLKRLADAERDGDRVLAVIHGSAVNHDGASSGLTVPNGPAQEALLRDALGDAGVAASAVGYVEAHGTATALGDPIEVGALNAVFGDSRPDEAPLLLGSVKTNVGHLEAAAGMAGLLKVVLALRHERIPAHLHFTEPSPRIPWAELPIRVTAEATPWPRGGRRLAGISSFGLSGTNAHVVVGEAPAGPELPTAEEADPSACLLPLSARSPEALEALAGRYAAHLETHPEQRLDDVCFTAAVGRGHHGYRLAAVASDRGELHDTLAAFAAGGDTAVRTVSGRERSGIVFVFPGQGSQWPDMGRKLIAQEPVFRDAVRACDAAVRRWAGWSVQEHLTREDEKAWPDDVVQPMLFTMAVSLTALWRSWGVEPDAVAGVSQGEIAAAHVAGILSLDEAARVVCERSRIIRERSRPGLIAVVQLPEAEVAERLAGLEERVAVAVVPSPRSTVIAGDPREVEELAASWEAEGAFCRVLKVAYASHTPHMEPLMEPIAEALRGLSPGPASIPMVSTVTGEWVEGPELAARYWCHNLRRTVRLDLAVGRLTAEGHDVFVEQSAHPSHLPALSENFEESPRGGVAVGSLKRDSGGRDELLRSVGELYRHGLQPDWRRLSGEGRRRVALPTYPFQRQRYWVEATPAPSEARGDGESPDRWLYQVAWEETEEAGGNRAPGRKGSWLVFADRGGAGADLAEHLRQRGDEPILVHAGSAFRRSDEHTYEVDPRSPEDFRQVLEEVSNGDGVGLHGAVHLWSLDTAPAAEMDLEGLGEARNLGCTSVLHLVQAMAGRQDGVLWLVTRGAVGVSSEETMSPAQAPLWGLGRVISLEHPELRGARIDLGSGDSQEVRALAAELRAGSERAATEVALRRDRRLVPRLRRFAPPSSPETEAFRADGTYLVTGGLGGLGLTVARWMVEKGARHLVLTGRRGPSEEARGVLEVLRESGARVRIARGDIADPDAVAAALASPEAGEPPIRGILHAAGVLEDRTLLRQDEGRFASVMAPKVEGAWNLHQASAGLPLDFFVLFSSTAALLGSPGQGNYAAANAFLDALAEYRSADGLPAVSIGWGAWSEVGLVRGAKRVGNIDRHGLGWISPRQGVALLGELLDADAAAVAVLPVVDPERAAASLSADARFRDTFSGHGRRGAARDLSAEIAAAPTARRRELVEEYLCGLLVDVLRVPRSALAAERPLQGHGIDSLMDLELRNRIRRELKLTVPVASFLKSHSLGELAADVADRLEGAGQPERPGAGLEGVHRIPRDERFYRDGAALSFAQQRLWFLDRLVPDHHFYNVPQFFRLTGPLDVALLAAVLREVERRHETLRTRFADVEGAPVQLVRRPGRGARLAVALVDLAGLEGPRSEAEGRRLADEESVRPFDLARGPLVRGTLLRLRPERHLWLLMMHHVITDGWSLGVLNREWKALYEAALARRPSPLPELPVQYADFAVWQRRVLSGGVLEGHLNYWRGLLGEDPPALQLPFDRPRPAVQSFRGGRCEAGLPGPLVEALRDLGRREGTTLTVTVLAGFLALLHRTTGQRRILVGSSSANRGLGELEGLIGFFVNNLVMAGDFSNDAEGREPGFRQLLGRVREMALAAYTHQELPFEKLVDELGLPRDLSRNPLVQVVFNMQQTPSGGTFDLAETRCEPAESTYRSSRFDVELHQWETAEALVGFCSYDPALFDATTVARLVAHYRNLLAAICEDPASPLGSLAGLGAGERHQLAFEWNDTAAVPDVSPDRRVDELFAAQAARTPERLALVDAEPGRTEQLSYGELWKRAERLARHLRGLGVGPESRVAVRMERGPAMVTAVTGVLVAGGAYVPLDPGHPEERLRFMTRDAGVSVTLVGLEDDGSATGEPDVAPAPPKPGAESLAYVMYTSGSTGRPKGVAVTHRGIVRLVVGSRYARFDAERTFLLAAPMAFDASTFELWGALLNGARCVLAPRQVPDARNLRRTLAEHRVDTLWLTASLFNAVVEEEPAALAGLEQLLIGGEALSVSHVRRYRRRHPATRLVNGYGPTENTTFTCCHPIPADVDGATASIPIGRPIAGTRVHVLDARRRRAALGSPGQLCFSGAGLARGYFDRPGLCAERFVPDPFEARGGRLYLSGDRVRHLASGEIEFLGRFDHQVKVRGFRIELGEVEAVLGRHPAIERCVVAVRERREGTSGRLVAYVVAAGNDAPAPDRLREDLGASLPEHMVPTAFVFLDALPLTSSGKVDRVALPDPERPAPARGYQAPRNPVEATLHDVWTRVLGREGGDVGVHDNFFELGGDSILSIQITSRARRAGLEVTPRQIFSHQTIAALSQVVKHLAPERADVADPVPGEVPLLPIQHWFFEREWPERHHFNQAVLLELCRPLAVPILERAMAALAEQHDALHLRFAQDVEGWHQTQTPAERVPLHTVDLSRITGFGAEELERQATRVQAGMSLDAGPLARAVRFELGSESGCRLLLAVHHLVVDGVSWRILLEDLERATRQQLAGTAVDLGAKTASYQRWARALAEAVGAGDLDGDLAFWQALDSGAIATLPVDELGGHNTLASTCEVSAALDAKLTRALLRDVRKAYRTEINDVLLAALVLTLGPWIESCGSRPAGRREGPATLFLDLEGHGRDGVAEGIDVSRTVGWFTSIYPVRLDVGEAADPAAVLKAVKEQLRRVPHRGMSHGLLRHLSGDAELRRRMARLHGPQVAFNYLGQFDASLSAGEVLALAPESPGRTYGLRGQRAHLLEIDAAVTGGRLEVRWSYSGNCHRRSTIDALSRQYLDELRTLIKHCLSPDTRGFTPSDFPLAELDQTAIDHLVAVTLPEGAAVELEALYPLTPMQEGLLFHTLMEPSSGAYFEQMVCEIRGAVDVEAFEQAWRHVATRHPVLRSAPVWEGLEKPLSWVRRGAEVRLERRVWPAEDTLGSPESFLRADRIRGFELDRPPLMRLVWFDVPVEPDAEPSYVFVWSFHHLLLDGWSIANVLREVFHAYDRLSRGREPDLAPLPPYEDYVAWLGRRDRTASETFWRAYLASFSAPTPLPGAAARAPGEKAAYAECALEIADNVQASLDGWLRRRHLTLNTLVQGAWALLLSRYSSEHDVVFGVTVAGRPAQLPKVEEMVGLFINTLPMRAVPEGRAPLAYWLRELQEQQVELRRYESTPLPEVQAASEVASGVPLFESLLVFENYPVDAALTEDHLPLSIRGARVIEQTHYPLTLIAVPGSTLRLTLSHDRARIAAATAWRLARNLATLLAEIAADPERRLGELPSSSLVERHQLLLEWNATSRDVQAESLLHGLFEARAARTPDTVALLAAHTGHHLSGAELNERADRLAQALSGLPPETRVGLCLERCPAMVVGMLAILKAGGAYVPLDPAYPRERLELMARDARITVLLTREQADDASPELARRTIYMDEVGGQFRARRPWGRERSATQPEGREAFEHRSQTPGPPGAELPANLAYVIYTSGSTGRPKGVAITHRGAVGLVTWACRAFSGHQLSGVLASTSMCFDLSVFELFVPLAGEGRVILADDALALAEQPAASGVTLINTVPSAMAELLRLEAVPESVRVVNLAGEALSAALVREVFRHRGSIERLYNLYGPSEDTTYSTYAAIAEGETSPAIGVPVAGKRAYVLDRDLRPVPTGASGGLFLGGTGLARGYLRRPKQTAEKFLPDPVDALPGGRLYDSGDLARHRTTGEIEYLGRADHQVKVRGFRIELGEIEAGLARHAAVAEAVVLVREDPGGHLYLAAYVLPREAGGAAAGELREWLLARLPAYMVPSTFELLDAMPRTPNGKVDRRALSGREARRPEASRTYVAPRNPVERELAEVWATVLGVDRVGIDDDFFALGGHSLLATQVFWRCRKAFGVDLPMRALFDAPTVSGLAETVTTLQWLLETPEPSSEGEMQEVGEL